MRILAIDISHLFRRCYEATGGKELSEAYKRTVQTVADIRVGYDRVAILCDAGPSFRTAIDPSFKADRERPAAPFYEQQMRTINRLRDDGCVAFYAPSVTIEGDPRELYAEADDLCASLAAWYETIQGQGHVDGMGLDIYSGDKSLLQLVDDAYCVRVICPDKGAQDAAAVEKRIGLPPSRIVDWLALAGKSGDNYKPFPGWTDAAGKHNGIGVVTAVSMVVEHGSAPAAVAMLDAKDDDDNPAHGYKPAVFAALSRGLPTPTAAVVRGLNLATLRRDLEVDFSPLLAEPVYARISEEQKEARHQENVSETMFDPPIDNAAEIQGDLLSAPEFIDPDAGRAGVATSAAITRSRDTSAVSRFGEQYRAAETMMLLAERFYDSRMFGGFPNAQAIFTVLWLAQERGEKPGHALINSYVIKAGKAPAYYATYLAALVRGSDVCKVFRIIETTATYCIVAHQRIDEAEVSEYRFDIQEAIDAGWVKKDGAWSNRPRVMCQRACVRECAKAFFYDVVSGMGDTAEDDGAGL